MAERARHRSEVVNNAAIISREARLGDSEFPPEMEWQRMVANRAERRSASVGAAMASMKDRLTEDADALSLVEDGDAVRGKHF